MDIGVGIENRRMDAGVGTRVGAGICTRVGGGAGVGTWVGVVCACGALVRLSI